MARRMRENVWWFLNCCTISFSWFGRIRYWKLMLRRIWTPSLFKHCNGSQAFTQCQIHKIIIMSAEWGLGVVSHTKWDSLQESGGSIRYQVGQFAQKWGYYQILSGTVCKNEGVVSDTKWDSLQESGGSITYQVGQFAQKWG